ncbi:hypothetical protein FAGAP_4331 [Fusarium agapanthi]|uniref:Copper-fist domain-containing protein n=1 Tax=Fusarium agapanthi TaxID=1803897 RepID=A0A9P5BCQ3_9HYPO|nr:hypothetical protein FAGAP_4331 [Fusarium agapanthi]
MRTNEQGEKIACSKCRVGHRTSKCVDTPGHQDDVQVIRSAGRPEGSKTDPARSTKQREKKRRRRAEKAPEDKGAAALQQGLHAFLPQRAASASSARACQPVLANQFNAMEQNLLVSDQVTGFPQVGMMAQADEGNSMMRQAIPEDPMGAGYIVPSVASAPFSFVFPSNVDLGGIESGDRPNTWQIGLPIPAAISGVRTSSSQSSSWSSVFLGHPTSENSLNTGVPGPGSLANQGGSASSSQYSFHNTAFHVTDPCAGEGEYDPVEESGCPVETPGGLFSFSYDFM